MAEPAPRRAGLPLRVYLFVAATALGAVPAIALSTVADGAVHGARAATAAVLLGALTLFAHRRPVPLGPQRRIDIGTAPEVCAVLLLPGPWAVLTLGVAAFTADPPRGTRPIQRIFNTAVACVRAGLGAGVLQGFQTLGPATVHDWLAPVAAAFVMYASTVTLVWGITGVQLRAWPLRRARMPARELLIADTVLSMTGMMAAAAAAAQFWTLLLLAGPALIAQRALRDSIALREQTRVAEAAREEAQSALAVREAFLSIAAHELRTPLTALRSFQQIAIRRLERGQDVAEVLPLLAGSDAQMQRLGRLIQDLLDAAQLTSGQLAIHPTPVPLLPLVQRAVDVARTVTPDRVIALQLPAEAPLVTVDEGRLEQVLLNLIDNARKYSQDETTISVTVGSAEEQVSIAVEDRGIGIAPEEHERILARFHRGTNVDPGISGLGLGLHIANEIIQAHSGTLIVQSSPGQGTTMTITLPRFRNSSPF